MKKRYIVNLTPEERASLEDIAKRQRVSALKRQRALILLRADDELTDVEIAEELEVGRATVERVRQRCVERGIVAALERKAQQNPSRPRCSRCSIPPVTALPSGSACGQLRRGLIGFDRPDARSPGPTSG